MEEVNKKLVKEFNEGSAKVYLCKIKKNKLEVFRDVGVAEMVDKEINKVVDEVTNV